MSEHLFNVEQYTKHKIKIASNYHNFNFLRAEVAQRLLTRITLLKHTINNALDVGCFSGEVANILSSQYNIHDITNIDITSQFQQEHGKIHTTNSYYKLDFPDNSFDLITSVFSLHHYPDLDKILQEMYRILRPGKCILISLPMIGSYANLFESIELAEYELFRSYHPRFVPLMDVKTFGNLIQTTKFKETVTDDESLTIMYSKFKSIFQDLIAMGEAQDGKLFSSPQNKKIYSKAKHNIMKKYLKDNHLPLTVNIGNAIAWKV